MAQCKSGRGVTAGTLLMEAKRNGSSAFNSGAPDQVFFTTSNANSNIPALAHQFLSDCD